MEELWQQSDIPPLPLGIIHRIRYTQLVTPMAEIERGGGAVKSIISGSR